MQQPITGYHRDDDLHWVAELACGHFQHVRHDPPWQERPWVVTPEGRDRHRGSLLGCRKCDAGAPADAQAAPASYAGAALYFTRALDAPGDASAR